MQTLPYLHTCSPNSTRYKPESCVLRLMWRKIHIKAMDLISGESLYFFVFGWRGYLLLDLICMRNYSTQCRKKIKTNRNVIVSRFSYCSALCSCTVPPRVQPDIQMGTGWISYWGKPCNRLASLLRGRGMGGWGLGVERCLIDWCYKNWDKLW